MTEYAYPLLFTCRIPESLPCPSRGAEKLLVRTLEAAANHKATEITVPKKGIYWCFWRACQFKFRFQSNWDLLEVESWKSPSISVLLLTADFLLPRQRLNTSSVWPLNPRWAVAALWSHHLRTVAAMRAATRTPSLMRKILATSPTMILGFLTKSFLGTSFQSSLVET